MYRYNIERACLDHDCLQSPQHQHPGPGLAEHVHVSAEHEQRLLLHLGGHEVQLGHERLAQQVAPGVERGRDQQRRTLSTVLVLQSTSFWRV